MLILCEIKVEKGFETNKTKEKRKSQHNLKIPGLILQNKIERCQQLLGSFIQSSLFTVYSKSRGCLSQSTIVDLERGVLFPQTTNASEYKSTFTRSSVSN